VSLDETDARDRRARLCSYPAISHPDRLLSGQRPAVTSSRTQSAALYLYADLVVGDRVSFVQVMLIMPEAAAERGTLPRCRKWDVARLDRERPDRSPPWLPVLVDDVVELTNRKRVSRDKREQYRLDVAVDGRQCPAAVDCPVGRSRGRSASSSRPSSVDQ
jgi:hypothetical protein